MSSPFKKETTWRTNRRTKKPFPNPLGSDLDRGASRQEKVDAPTESSASSYSDFFFCEVCEQNKSGSHYTVSGHLCCRECMSDYKSGRMQAEADYARAQELMTYSTSSTGDSEHTHMGICSVCNAPHQRNLCSDGHNACYSCRPPGCRFRR